MSRPHATPPLDHHSVLHLLQPIYGSSLDPAALESLACAILPYLQRTTLPLSDAVSKIACHYLQDGARVQRLVADPEAPEWQSVLTQVLTFATKHALYPDDCDATSWPDLDAYRDIQVKLRSYNFEGSLDSWVTVTILNRLRRFWRDRQALSAGGPGFSYKATRTPDSAPAERPAAGRALQYSLEALADDEQLAAERLGSDLASVGYCVEAAELHRMIEEAVRTYALHKHDAQIPQIWHAVVDQQFKLREASDRFGLTISQVHRRLEQVRAYLRQDPHISLWFNHND